MTLARDVLAQSHLELQRNVLRLRGLAGTGISPALAAKIDAVVATLREVEEELLGMVRDFEPPTGPTR